MAFEPGLQNAGVPSTRAPYLDGQAGVRQSLEAMSQKMREGRLDQAVIGWARGVLKDAGLDGRGSDSRRNSRAQVGALLTALRSQAVYAPDAFGAEVISSAAATLCLRPNLCLNGGDCDDLTIALGSAVLSLAIPVVIVKQSFGRDNQEHVLMAFQDESGNWVYADPSTNLPLGRAPNAVEEVWVDPMGPIGALPEAHAEIVTLGGIPNRRAKFMGGRWWEETSSVGVCVYDEKTGWTALGFGRAPGLGTIFGNHTANELSVDLLNWQGFVATMAAAVAEQGSQWQSADAPGWTAWKKDWDAFLARWNPARDHAMTVIADAKNSWLGLDWTPVEDEYQTVLQAYQNGSVPSVGGLDDLVRRWAQANKAPLPQFTVSLDPNAAPDADLIAYQSADKAVKAIESAASSVKDPAKFGVVAFLLGVGVAVAAVVVVKKVL
jgi:hypothetical protein